MGELIVLHTVSVVCKGKKSRTVVTEWLHISGSIRLKRLQFEKLLPWPLEHSWLNWILLLSGKMVCKGNESFIADCKGLSINSPLGCYLLNLFKFITVPFLDEWVDTERGVIIMIWNNKKLRRSLSHRRNVKKKPLPEQFHPFPVKPGSHLQLKCPAVFTQGCISVAIMAAFVTFIDI